MGQPVDELTPSELRKLRGLKTPHSIQRYLEDMPYHVANTCWSPRRVMRENTAHCFEAATLAAAALRLQGHPPLVLDLEAERDTDHVIAVYRLHGHWGAIAKSNYSGCRYREPVYRSLRELALSYFDCYFNLRRERSLRRFSRPVNLKRFDLQGWMTTEGSLAYIALYLFDVPHYALITPSMAKRLHRLDERSFRAGLLGSSAR